MNDFVLVLPKLSLPNITILSTFLKLIEELGEAKEEFEKLEAFEKQNIVNLVLLSDSELNETRLKFKHLLADSLKEVIDITQTCVSLLFVFEETKKVDSEMVKKVLSEHLQDIQPDYLIQSLEDFYIIEKNGYKYMNLPSSNREMDLSKTLDGITIVSGKYAQLMGKYSRLNGEEKLQKDITEQEVVEESLKCIIQIAQNSLDLLRFMSNKYNISLEVMFKQHVDKLKHRGYLS